ncbi:acyl-CoA dehydrogenase family protein [Azospirillum soli]|uniref:acyl-CoA dehydrogenase family protein n=1 Tax=Azospirillum soli TaxID=1304799 RepID=UPI001AE9F1AC|nr:acyl-CoA dehydrogenase family protein [Azospirillum soli]MBP2312576.1 alkylation response protein AidB-like acyl-CoA dehydrogenase [Azospirillum soli]
MTYTAPLRDIRFTLEEVAGIGAVAALPGYEEATEELRDSILDEAAKIAGEVLAPLNRVGDTQGAKWVDGNVTTPEGWSDAWNTLVEGGWNGLPFDAQWGGMGLPNVLNTAVQEMWHAANMAFALNPMLTQGAVNALQQFASDELKQTYLPRMVSGEWTGTMNLTEPQAGSDLAAIRSKAEPVGDGSYKVFGQKIFITYGDHDLTDNIVHLVLARLPDAPAGVKGISLFVVPKFLVNADGSIGARNDVSCVSLEHKLGIHASPTAVLSFGDQGGALGWLVGEPHNGLAYMFVMMNHARQSVGLQGLSIAERAYQQALSYARDRVQGTPAGWKGEGRTPIVNHPDVRRLLMGMKARIEAMRGILYTAAAAHDVRHHHADAEARAKAAVLEELLTPIAKGWSTEMGQDIASVGVQVHGGMGFIEETGAAQHLRDARITTIYEGTTAIQANDLVNRKLLRDKGAALTAYLAEVSRHAEELTASADANLQVLGRELALAAARTGEAAAWILANAGSPALAAGAAVPLLHAMGLVAGGHYLAIGARAALKRLAEGAADDGFLAAKPVTARFYAEHLLGQVEGYRSAVVNGTATVMALDDAQL